MQGTREFMDASENDAAGIDIVYILKKDITSEELRYSLRSVEKNFTFHRLWFFGGCPDYAVPDRYCEFQQRGFNKWQRSTSTIRAICKNKEVTDDFWLFNDDFFILKKVNGLPYMVGGTLEQRVNELDTKYGRTRYMINLEETRTALEGRGLPSFNYALHLPMRINKKKAIKVLDEFPRHPMFRSLYGNYWKVGGNVVSDVKIYDLESVPSENQILLSTTETAFKDGKVGEFVRNRFPKPCRWESK